jgi:hypothetical protein
VSGPAHRSGGRLSTGLLLGSVALLFGAGGVAYVGLTTGAGGSPGAAPGFLATGPGVVEYLALSGDSGPVSGRARIVRSGGIPPTETASGSTVAVSGTLSATRVKLSFVGAGTRQGTRIGASSFTLGRVGPPGRRAPLVFRRASVAAFDAAVTGLDDEVGGADRLAGREQAVIAAGARVATDLGDLGQATTQAATTVAAQAGLAAKAAASSDVSSADDDLARSTGRSARPTPMPRRPPAWPGAGRRRHRLR